MLEQRGKKEFTVEEHLEDLRGEKKQRWRKLQVSKVGEEN